MQCDDQAQEIPAHRMVCALRDGRGAEKQNKNTQTQNNSYWLQRDCKERMNNGETLLSKKQGKALGR